MDFTVPSATIFAQHCRIQSTPVVHNKPMVSCDDDLTSAAFNLARNRIPSVSEDAAAVVAKSDCVLKNRRGLSPIDEISREYFSSSGSSAGTTGLALSKLFSLELA